jgi:O-antigen/teichoic acid export membrane protein
LLIQSVGENLYSVLLTQTVITWVILIPGIIVLRQSLQKAFCSLEMKSVSIPSMVPSQENVWDYATLMLTQLTFFACTQVDIWIAPFVIREDDLVWYLAPRRLVMLTSAPLQLLNLTIVTKIPELLSLGRKHDLQKLLWKSATIGFVPAALILCLFLSFPTQLLSLIYGSQFDAGRDVLRILSGAQLINAWTGSCGIVLMMGGQQRSVLLVNFLVAFILVAAVFLIYPKNPFQLSVIAGAATAVQYLMLWGMTRAIMGLWTNAGLRPAPARAT